MKKIIFVLGIVISSYIPHSVRAQCYVSNKVAESVAVNFMRRVSTSIPIVSNVSLESMNGVDCIYKIIFSDSSWCIVPTNRIAYPILAYGSSPIDDVNDGLNYLIEWYKSQISSLGMRTDVSEVVDSLWNSLLHGSSGVDRYSAGVSLLNSTGRGTNKWHQFGNNGVGCTPSYNQECPISDSCECGHKPVGCGAVAIGQTLWYWSWVKNNSYLENYNWELIPGMLNVTTPSNSVKAITTFLRDCGTIVDMTYWCAGAWTIMENIVEALQNHGYESAKKYLKSDWDDGSWPNLIRSEIDNNRPVIYYGDEGLWSSGHFFVIDGYDANNPYLFHINYGHGGAGNGYATLDNITDYPYNQRAIVGISPKIPQNITQLPYSNVTKCRREVAVTDIQLPGTNGSLTVVDTGTLYLVAGSDIVLSPGFHATHGSLFTASIDTNLYGSVEISVPGWPNAYALNSSSPFYIYAYNANSVECYILDRNGNVIFQRAGSITSDTVVLWDGVGANGTGVYTCYVRLKNSYGRAVENLFTITAIRGDGFAKSFGNEIDVPKSSLWNKVSENNEVVVYPNPTNGIVNISFQKQEPFKLYVRSESGQLIHYVEQTATSQYMVDITPFPHGVYLVTIEMESYKITKKISLL